MMAQAEFALDDQEPQRALDAVDRMSAGGSGQQIVALETALGAYQQSGRWDQVLETVRQLVRRGRLQPAEAESLRLTAYRQLLTPRANDAKAIRELWKSLKADERKQASLAAPTVVALAAAAAPEDAKRIAFSVMDVEYDESIAEAYGAMSALPARQRLEQLERWRARHGDQPKLLEMLGRICASERLWGKAEAYLVGSLTAGDSVSARVALAQLCESIGRPADAALQFEYAARLALGERPPLPVVGANLPGAPAIPSDGAPATGSSAAARSATVAAAGVAGAIPLHDELAADGLPKAMAAPTHDAESGAANVTGGAAAAAATAATGFPGGAAAPAAVLSPAASTAVAATSDGDIEGSESDAPPPAGIAGSGDTLGFIGRRPS